MTNHHFGFKRFGAYFKKILVERQHSIVVSILILLGIMLIGEMWTAIVGYDFNLRDTDFTSAHDPIEDELFVEATLLFLIGGCVAAAQQFSEGQQKAGRIGVLTTPVSTFESWLIRWLIYVPGYILTFFFCFYLADLLRVAIFAPLLPNTPVEVANVLAPSDISSVVYLELWSFYLFITSWYVLGCYFFPKRPLLSTTITVFLLGMTFVFLLFLESDWLDNFNASQKGALNQAAIGWMLFHTVCNWWLSYKRLKDMEVIDHN